MARKTNNDKQGERQTFSRSVYTPQTVQLVRDFHWQDRPIYL